MRAFLITTKCEVGFGADMTDLLKLQASAEPETKKESYGSVPIDPSYVTSFLTITARQIEDWGTKSLDARNQLSVLVRRLIHATGQELQQVDFPGYDNAQRHGFDGRVLSGAAALNVPTGRSVWELSVRQKANDDYAAGLRKLPPDQQAEHTFIFVTTRNWKGKDNWAQNKNGSGNWKEVRAYDASDLEQWLETTVEPRIWLAEQMGIPTDGFQTIEAHWDAWASGADPQIIPKIFAPSIDRSKKEFQKWLESPPDRPLIVVGDSREEATAFIACLLQEVDCASASPGSAVVFESVNKLKSLTRTTSPFIVVVCNEEVEQSIVGVYKYRHCIIVRPRNAPFGVSNPDIVINPLDPISFEDALLDMGIAKECLKKLARQSGLSPTILRRRLSKVPATQTPPWAADQKIARKLIPMALVGAWHGRSKADHEILKTMADDSYDNIESAIAELHQIADCPIWSIDNRHGVVSMIDAIYAIAPLMVKKDLENFIDIAEYVLSETDPALDLPEDKRWLSILYNKVREHSSMLRSGVRDTLTFLAVRGNELFEDRLGVDVESEVSALVKRLLTPLTGEKLESYDGDLPDFAEAAPSVFLDILQKDLQRAEPALQSLLRPAAGGLFSSLPRTGLLWALERSAWYPEHLGGVINILAELSHTTIDDNWVNKPVTSLASIFHAWFPQTSVPAKERILLLQQLCKKFPDVGWQICIRQINRSNSIAEYSALPRWRAVASNVMTPAGRSERHEFERAAFDLIVNWPDHNARTLGDLIPCLPWMGEDDQSKILDCVARWAQTEPDENERAEIRKQIGRLVYGEHRFPPRLSPKIPARRLREIFQQLIPKAPFERLALPFKDYWDYFQVAKAEDPSLERSDWQERYDEVCKQSMQEIWSSHGIGGVFKLLCESNSSYTIGRYATSQADNLQSGVEVIQECLKMDMLSNEKINDFVRGFLEELGDDKAAEVFLSLAPNISDDNVTRISRCLRFNGQTWDLLDKLPDNIRDQYWKKVVASLGEYSKYETRKLVENLLRVRRPWSAINALRADWDRVETPVLMQLLREVTEKEYERIDYYGTIEWDMPEALKSLGRRPGVSVDEMAQLEFASIEWLLSDNLKVSNLEKQIEDFPIKFVYFLYLIANRDRDEQYPKEWRVNDGKFRERLIWRALRLFKLLRQLPGQDEKGEINLRVLLRWISEVRRIARDYGLIQICDDTIGQWLSRGSKQEDSPWPKRPICEALEYIASKEVHSGFRTGVREAHGFISRFSYEGGGSERDLAAKYRERAEVWMIEFPFVSKILRSIADSYDKDAEREDQHARLRQLRDL